MTNSNVKRLMQGSKVLAVIVGVLMVILGALFFFFPLKTMLLADIFITIGLLAFGVYKIIIFIAGPKGFRDGWDIALGIMFVVCAAIVLASSAANILLSFAMLLGMLAMMVGLSQIVSYGAIRGTQGAGFVLASGIINLVLALFLLFAPYASTAALAYIEGIYFCFIGVALIIEGFSKHPANYFEALEDELD